MGKYISIVATSFLSFNLLNSLRSLVCNTVQISSSSVKNRWLFRRLNEYKSNVIFGLLRSLIL